MQRQGQGTRASVTIDKNARGEAIGECTEELLVCCQVEGDDESGEQVEGILFKEVESALAFQRR